MKYEHRKHVVEVVYTMNIFLQGDYVNNIRAHVWMAQRLAPVDEKVCFSLWRLVIFLSTMWNINGPYQFGVWSNLLPHKSDFSGVQVHVGIPTCDWLENMDAEEELEAT